MASKFRHLPVTEDGQVVSILDISKCLYDALVLLDCGPVAFKDLLSIQSESSAASMEALRGQAFQPTVGSLLMQASKVSMVAGGESVTTAVKKMVELNTDYVIVATESNTEQGIFTSKDLLLRVVSRNLPCDSTAVHKVMTPEVECAGLDITIVEALHVMHDGRFCHLPTVDQASRIVGCVGILDLVEAGFGRVAEKTHLDVKDSDSDVSTTKLNSGNAVKLVYPSLWLSCLFSFKFEDSKGCVHRFNCETNCLEDLAVAIAKRIGADKACLQILYKDDEGDFIVLSSDEDLALAVGFAKASGMKVLRLYADYCTKSRLQNWKTTLHTTTVIASILVLMGLGILFHARRSVNESWGMMFDKLLSMEGQVQGS